MSFSNYEQEFVFDGYILSGVQSVDASYGISEKKINVAGVGFIDAIIDQPLEGNFSISRQMVSADPVLELDSAGKYKMDENSVSGAIFYENKGFGFSNGRVNRYSVSCSVGDIPSIETDITIYGDLGKDIASDLKNNIKDHPPIKFTDQAGIKLSVSDFQIDPVSDFSYSRSINIVPAYALPQGGEAEWAAGSEPVRKNLEPVQMDTQYPIETDINFTMIAEEYEIRQIRDRIQSAPKSDVKIELHDARDGTIINAFTGKNVRLISESINSSVEGELSITLTYKGYESRHNQFI